MRVYSGTTVLNVFINDLYYFIKNAKLLNVVDDNTISTFSNSVNDLITDLREESEMTRDWYYW